MISNPFFLLSILISTFLAFSTCAFIVEMGIRIFSIKKYRMRSILRLLPFFSLSIDFVMNRFSMGNWLNPLSCDSCVQKFVLQVVFPNLGKHLTDNQISLVEYLAIDGFSGIFILFCCVTGYFLVSKMLEVFLTCRSLYLMENQGTPYKITIQNKKLEEAMAKAKVQLLMTQEVQMPLVGYNSTIFIPSPITKILSPNELEAVIAHELEHLRSKDFFIKVFCQMITALAWWIPLKSWLKTIEQEIELACDHGTAKYGAQFESLASAMLKLVKEPSKQPMEEVCYFTDHRNPVLIRIQVLLGISPRKQKNLLRSTGIGVAIGIAILFGCIKYL